MGDQTNQTNTSTSGGQNQEAGTQAGKTFTQEQLDAIIADRLQVLQVQAEQELARFAARATERIEAGQRRLTAQAERDAEALARAGLGEPPPGVTVTWARLPKGAIEQLVGTLQDGSPLRELFDSFGPAASAMIRRELVSGLALGVNPREVARWITGALNGDRLRAETIARTEMLRSYREASRASYLANSDVVKGWVWHSAADERTCEMCWAMHGTEHTLEEHLDDHPRGRCAMLPLTRTWKELGFNVPETRAEVESGESLFARLSEEQQRAILGDAGYEAYKAGAVKLSDFVGQKSDPRWGTMRYARSLKEILGAGEARKWYGRATEAKQPTDLSLHPVDRLIRDLIRSGQGASASQVESIAAHIAQAEFPTIAQHLNTRVEKDSQWAKGTTGAEYRGDLRAATTHKDARIGIYRRRGGHMAGIIIETDKIIPRTRLGINAERLLFVAYSADRGIIVSGYQASAIERISIPESVQWIR